MRAFGVLRVAVVVALAFAPGLQANEGGAEPSAQSPAAAEEIHPEAGAPPAEPAAAAPPSPAEAPPEATAAADAAPVTAAEAPEPAASEASPAEAAAAAAASNGTPSASKLGPVGYDAEGHEGRVHFVVRGDTLWDIAALYLATPWVWPSIWRDNRSIANPHRIYPGDRIWITDGEMRVVSAQEAEEMIHREPPAAPAAEPAKLDVSALQPPPAEAALQTYHVSTGEHSGLVTPEQLEASASVVAGVRGTQMYAMGDEVYVGLGEGQAKSGDRLTAFRVDSKVIDPEDGHLLGYHVDMKGWLELAAVHPESSTGMVRQSLSEIEVGDRVMPREEIPAEVSLKTAPPDLRGQVAFVSVHRAEAAQEDFVYLNRGSQHGLEVGSLLEVFRPGRKVPEAARGEDVMLPDRPAAELLVLRVQPESCVALVMHSEHEIEVGDAVRAATRMPLAAR